MTPQEQTLLSRVRPDSANHGAIRHLFGLGSRLAAERARLSADQNISDTGRRAKEAEFTKSLVKNLAELTRPLRRAEADASAKRANFKLPEVDKTDAVGELRRQEVRAYLRNLPLADRVTALDTLGDDATLAVIDAAPSLSGLPPDRHEFVKTRYLKKRFGSQMRALKAIDEDNVAVKSAASMVRRDLQVVTGLSNVDFSALEQSHEN